MSDLRKALDRFEVAVPDWHEGQQGIFVAPASLDDGFALVAAARRFLALTKTGPDYEAAARAWMEEWGTEYEVEDVELVRLIVDAALADYLTEEL